jgi:glycerate-2-kinase
MIKNRSVLEISNARRLALDIIEEGLFSVSPQILISKAIQYSLNSDTIFIQNTPISFNGGRIFIVGGGKASGLMSTALEKLLPLHRITSGVVVVKSNVLSQSCVKFIKAAHPLPDDRGCAATGHMLSLKNDFKICEKDIVLCLISGGGSALIVKPVPDITLVDLKRTTELLLASGATINEINTVRKHLSMVKGGMLAQHYFPARVISLIISDVVGNDLSTIASGPTVPDPTTFQDAYDVFETYGLEKMIPKNVSSRILRGIKGIISETPKELSNTTNFIIGDNNVALDAMFKKATDLGLKPSTGNRNLKGDTEKMAEYWAQCAISSQFHNNNAIILGGETTLKLPSKTGAGGRNQHYAAVSLEAFKDYPQDWLVTSIGSDGSDYLPGIAGAIVDQNSLKKIREKKLPFSKYINRYDSYNLLSNIGNSLVITGDTGTNVGDFVLYVL